jgi:hypothetical protein
MMPRKPATTNQSKAFATSAVIDDKRSVFSQGDLQTRTNTVLDTTGARKRGKGMIWNELISKSAAVRLCSVLLVLLLTGVAMLGQVAGRGSVTGTITDQSGAVISGAEVSLLNQATGVTSHTTSNRAGFFSFISLSPGMYQITAQRSGFTTVNRNDVVASVDAVTQVNITLHVGAKTENIVVRESSDLAETTNATVGSLISANTMNRLPLLYRNVDDVVQLSPGVIPVNGSPNSSDSMQSIENISNGRPGVEVSSATINGALQGSLRYMIDGSPIDVAEHAEASSIPGITFPEEAIEEIRVETQNTPAYYQSGAAGVISLGSKSGTNAFHGSVFGFFRPNILSANEYFNKQTEQSSGESNTPPDFHRYQEGAAIGGPIKKDKVFFFGDYEDTQQQQFEGINYFSVPTSAERTGDFSAMSFNIYDPTQPDTAGGMRQPFPGNKILNPNPIGLLFLSKYPKCNLPSSATCDSATTDVNNFGAPGLDPFNAHKFDVRVDWDKSEKQRFFARFSYGEQVFAQANSFPSGWDPYYAQNNTKAFNALLADDLTLNSTTVLNLRYSFTRRNENQGNAAYSNVNLTTLGFPSSLATQQLLKQLPVMVFNDLPTNNQIGGTGNGNIFADVGENSDANATLTKIVGRHQLVTGFEWMKRYLNTTQPAAPAGTYSFDLSATDQQTSPASGVLVGGSDFASILVGMGTAPGGESTNFTNFVAVAESNPYYATFLQDTYHLLPNLTITAGLRWDIYGGRNERHNRLEYFDPTIGSTADGVSFTGAEVYVGSKNRSPFKTNLKDFGPRLGFTWQPSQNLAVRAGAGIYYGPSSTMVADNGNDDSDGYNSSTDWNATCYNSDGNTVFNGPGCPTPSPGNFTGVSSLSNPFPSGLVPIGNPPPGLNNNLGTSLEAVIHAERTQTIYNYNFGLEYQLPQELVVSIAYVGSRGLFLPFWHVDLNDLDLATIQKYGASLCVDTSSPSCQTAANTWEPILPATNANYGSSTIPLWAAVEPFPQFGNGSYGDGNGINLNGYPGGDSHYNSMQLKVQKNLTSHFSTLAAFTWGKLMTDDDHPPLAYVGSNSAHWQDWKDLRYDYGIASQDVKYTFVGSASYDLPIGTGRRVDLNRVGNAVVGSWTVDGILYLGSGIPITSPVVGASVHYFTQRANLTCNPSKGFTRSVTRWVNNSCFASPASPFVPGTTTPYLDSAREMGAQDLDLSLSKSIKVRESKVIHLEISSFNLMNRPQFGPPTRGSMTSRHGAPYGQLTSTLNTPRQFQFAARFVF